MSSSEDRFKGMKDNENYYFDEEDEVEESLQIPDNSELDDDFQFIDNDMDYDVFRFDRRKQSEENNESESVEDTEAYLDDEEEYYDEESEEYYDEDTEEYDEEESEEYFNEDIEDYSEENSEESDEDATMYIDPEQVRSARVEGFLAEVQEPDLESMSKKERKAYLKAKKKEEKEQKKAAKKQAKLDKKNGVVSEQNGDEEEQKPKKWKMVLKILLLTLLGLVAAAYAAGAVYFYLHFGPNSVVNDVDVSFMNEEQVQNIIKEQVSGYSLKVIERKDAEETIKGSDVGLEYVPDGQVAEIMHAQNCLIWPYRLIADIRAEEAFTHASVQIDEAKFKEVVAGLNCSDPEQMIAPANAYPSLEGSVYAAHPEEEGTTIKPDVLEAVLKEALLSTADSVDLDENDCYIEPEIRADDPEIKKICDKKNELIGLSITYHFGDEIVMLDGATTDSWITWDDKLEPTINEDKIKEWAVQFGKDHDTVGKTRTFTGASGREVTVSGGSYGWSVDEEQEIEMVKQMFAERKSQDREPIWATTAASHDELDWGNSYIEVDIAAQHIWYIRDGQCIFENDVVTGLPTAARQTTPGVWSILEMKRNKVLRGTRLSDGSYEYETPVAYWMRITWTGIGFHDATWQPSFGGNRYTYAGSHGCINMSYNGAAQLYDIVSVGLPVIVHQ